MNAGLDWYRSIDAENDLELITIDVQLDVALEVEQIMENQGVSRKELAERIGHSPAYVTKVLSGDANMTISTMVKLANALDRRPRIEFINKKARRSWHDALPPTGVAEDSSQVGMGDSQQESPAADQALQEGGRDICLEHPTHNSSASSSLIRW